MKHKCDDCWWYWWGVQGPVCHHTSTIEEDWESKGRTCPWFDPKDEKNEQEDPVDIWN